MTFFTFYTKSIKTSFKSKLISNSTLFYILCLFSNIFIPLLIVYKSDGFWRKIEFFREQPDIQFKHNLILVLQLKHSEHGFKFWSTYPHLNKAFSADQTTVPYITSKELDKNFDGIYDELNLNLIAPLGPNDEVIGTQVILLFDYKLHSKIDLRMESMVNIAYNSVISGKGVKVIGDIVFNQKDPLIYRKHYIGLNDNTIGSKEFFIEDMIESHVRRNFSTSMNFNTHYNWYQRRGNSSKFEINITVIYSEQMFSYTPGLWFVMKWAFIQYISVFFILYLIIDKIKDFVFENRLLNCFVIYPQMNEK